MYLKKSGFICLNVYINLPYLYSIDILRNLSSTYKCNFLGADNKQ